MFRISQVLKSKSYFRVSHFGYRFGYPKSFSDLLWRFALPTTDDVSIINPISGWKDQYLQETVWVQPNIMGTTKHLIDFVPIVVWVCIGPTCIQHEMLVLKLRLLWNYLLKHYIYVTTVNYIPYNFLETVISYAYTLFYDDFDRKVHVFERKVSTYYKETCKNEQCLRKTQNVTWFLEKRVLNIVNVTYYTGNIIFRVDRRQFFSTVKRENVRTIDTSVNRVNKRGVYPMTFQLKRKYNSIVLFCLNVRFILLAHDKRKYGTMLYFILPFVVSGQYCPSIDTDFLSNEAEIQ